MAVRAGKCCTSTLSRSTRFATWGVEHRPHREDSLVLAREGLLTPKFSSIEEFPSAWYTTQYHRSSWRLVQGGRYQPERERAAQKRFW